MDELTRTLAKAREHVTTKDDEVVLAGGDENAN